MSTELAQPASTPLSPRFTQAFEYARRLHASQKRKGTEIPYMAHLLAVTSLVLEDGGDEDQAIAALLHDAVEDQGGYATLDEIRNQFGARVAQIVAGCTDAFTKPKPPWRGRKEQYIAHLRQASPEVVRVSLADKLHNARSILTDLHTDNNGVWERFNGGKEGSLWYYRQLVEIFRKISTSPQVEELALVVQAIEAISSSPSQGGDQSA